MLGVARPRFVEFVGLLGFVGLLEFVGFMEFVGFIGIATSRHSRDSQGQNRRTSE